MRKKYFLAWLAGLGMLFGLSALPALAADITYSANTTIDLSSPDIDITIVAGSVATSLVVETGSFTVVVPASSSFTVSSASRNLSVSGNSAATVVNLSCSSGTATLVLTAGTSAETVTVTPASGACTTGGGGGGGGGPTITAPVISSFTATPSSITAGQSATLSWNVANATSLSINQGVGSLPSSATGTKAVSPTVTTTYTLTATNAAAQSATATATVTIAGTTPAPITPVPGLSGGAHPNGTLVLDGSTIYLIKDGQRYGFRDAKEYQSHGYSFSQAVAANDTDKSLPTAGSNIIKALQGTLVLDASDNKTVYMIGTGNTKRGFATAEVFKALGYSFSGLPKINLSDYPAGDPIVSSAAVHPEGALVLEGKTVWWILGATRQGFESMAVFNTYGFSTSRIVKANAADLALSQGPLVKFRDGTLVKDGSSYFLISDGKKLSFASSADLTSRGYKTANAISASLANYESGGNAQ